MRFLRLLAISSLFVLCASPVFAGTVFTADEEGHSVSYFSWPEDKQASITIPVNALLFVRECVRTHTEQDKLLTKG